ncbi:hypothetical protein [Flavobacterium psychrotolerans]|uniref:Uncharacterized protein n=1 Tax=Flavobacterium psychrotolerans TaxID=2169410 RepID=A0A2U1JGT3_9FLAO|nr:hypothetical protein [Flavobacterium psychrotolerans]PWA04346.1 hypothetical protein DB895_11360 [Flavobacterium psychrotolerans]
MKNFTLLVAGILLLGNAAKASEIINYSGGNTKTNFSLNEPIEFTERGITFYVFANGEFDFNSEQSAGKDSYYRRAINTTTGAPGVQTNLLPINGGVIIEHDAMGRIRRIGNVFMNYDYENRIKRIGTVYMSYNRFALNQIGGLKIIYNRRGQIINIFGNVKGYKSNYGYCDSYETHFDNDNSTYQNNDNNQYYYRKNGDKAKSEDTK